METIEERKAEGSPTPSCRRTGEMNDLMSDVQNEEHASEDENRSRAEMNIRRDNKDRSTNKLTTENLNQRNSSEKFDHIQYRDDLEMEVEEDRENTKRSQPVVDKEQRAEMRREVPHRSFLERCFRKQIGLGIENPHRMNIYTFTDKRIAKGYQRVVTTCQGMYYEMKEEQVEGKLAWQKSDCRGRLVLER